MSNQKVFIVDDDQAMRNSLKWLIESVNLSVETFSSADDFMHYYYPGRAGCLLLDVRMPGMSGLDLQDKLKREAVKIPIIIITGHGDVPMAVRAMKAGAVDFIEKPFNDEVLLNSLDKALKMDLSQRNKQAESAAIATKMAQLTRREIEVMQQVTEGYSNREIAGRMDVSPKTVEAHRAHVMTKMEALSLADLVKMAVTSNAFDLRPLE